MDEDIVIPLAGMLMIVVLCIGIPLVRALGRRWEKEARLPRGDGEISQRLGHIEQAIDAMSLEIERISEGQRFVTRLLADKSPERVALPQESVGAGKAPNEEKPCKKKKYSRCSSSSHHSLLSF